MEGLPDNPVTFLVESYREIELHFPDFAPATKGEMALRFQRSFMDNESHRMAMSEFQLQCKQLIARLKTMENDEENR